MAKYQKGEKVLYYITTWSPMSGPETEVEEVIFLERIGGKNNLVKIEFSNGRTKTVKQADLTKV